ncbi:MAG: hypothetical protein J6Y80_00220, partial [Victivallales bacterium]|nr:hypothetical protein [Victivallales bacterium]
GIQKELQGSGLGSLVLDVVKHFLVERQQIGARFLTLDACPGRVGFCQKKHFRELQAKDDRTASETVPMFFDQKELLKPIPESGTLLR